MVKSMTGFGRGEYTDGKRRIVTEIKAVNHRYIDIGVKMSRRYAFAEDRIKNTVKGLVKRGKIDIYVMVEHITEDDAYIKLSETAAGQYYEKLKELKEKFSLSGDVSLELLASMPDVIKTIPEIDDEEEALGAFAASVKAAADNLDLMRIAEGEKLADDVLKRCALISEMASKIEDSVPEIVSLYYERLKERIKELTRGSIEIPEERIACEAAIIADKANITEELVRLASHIKQMSNTIANSSQPDGKKLDFLTQEMNREANTIGSKANNIDITNLMIEIKSEIEKIREQIQNIE